MNQSSKPSIIYFRKSSSSNNKDVLLRMESFARALGSSDIKIFSDLEESFHQPNLNNFLKSMSVSKYDFFCVPDLSHLPAVASSNEDFFNFTTELSKNSIRFLSVDENLDSGSSAIDFLSSAGAHLIKLKMFFKKERAYWGLMSAKINGTIIGRPKSADYSKINMLRGVGLTIRGISKELGISKGTVQHALKKYSD